MSVVVFLKAHEAKIVKTKCGRPKKLVPIKVWFVGRVYRMCKKSGIRWAEYKDVIDFMNCSSNMEIGFCWYQKGTNK